MPVPLKITFVDTTMHALVRLGVTVAADRSDAGPAGGAQAARAQPVGIGARGGERRRVGVACERCCSTHRAARCGSPRPRFPTPAPARFSSPSKRAGSAVPTCTSATASSPIPSCPLSSATRSSARSRGLVQAVDRFTIGQRVGVPWLGWSCGECSYCRVGRENLCDRVRFTGYQIDGGYAGVYRGGRALRVSPFPTGIRTSERRRSCAPASSDTARSSPQATPDGSGCTASALRRTFVAQVARYQGRRVFAFTRAGDAEAQQFAPAARAEWAGSSDAQPPEPLDAAIVFAPVGALVPPRCARLRKAARWSAREST